MTVGAQPIPHDTVVRLSRCMYEACGLEPVPVRPGSLQESSWKIFLHDLRALEDTADGPLRPSDVRAVIQKMRDDNRRGTATWSLRPSTILRDPERFFDLVLETRRRLRKRPPTITHTIHAGPAAALAEHDPATDLPDTPLRDLVRAQISNLKTQPPTNTKPGS